MTTDELKAEQGQTSPSAPPPRSEAGILEELRHSERRFRALQETSPNGFMFFDSVRDETGIIIDFEWLYANPSSDEISRNTVLGVTLMRRRQSITRRAA